MSTLFGILTVVFIVVSAAMVLIILVQRPQGGGLAGAFGGAGGGGTDTVFGGRVGDALTIATVIAFVVWLGLAVGLNEVESAKANTPPAQAATATSDGQPVEGMQEQMTPTGELQTGTRLPSDSQAPAVTDSTGQPVELKQIPADQVPEEIRNQATGGTGTMGGGEQNDAGGETSNSDNASGDEDTTDNPGGI